MLEGEIGAGGFGQVYLGTFPVKLHALNRYNH